MTPTVTCLMPTYKRFPAHAQVVNEALESFLRQDYPHKELFICNDDPGQFIALDKLYPNVLVFNLARRFRTLGEKLNFMASLGKGEYLTRWDDDDVSLPWRLSMGVERRPQGAHYWKPSRHWYYPTYELKIDGGYMSQALYTREAYDTLGGYPHVSVYEDQAWERLFVDRGDFAEYPVTIEEASYLYRWGDGSLHVSGFPEVKGYERMAVHAVDQGMFTVRPNWARDYVSLTREAAANGGHLALQGR